MSKTQKERESREKGPSMLVRLRGALAFFLVIVAVSCGYYYLHVQRKSDYLMNRNFRLLASMGKRIDATVGGQRKVLENLGKKKEFLDAVVKKNEQRKNEILNVLAPQFDSVKRSEEKVPAGVTSWHRTRSGPDGTTVRFFHAVQDKDGTVLEAEVRLDRLVQRSLASYEAFESVLLTDFDGEVVYQQGKRNLGITGLSAVMEPEKEGREGGGDPQPEEPRPLFGASEHREGVRIAGQRYQLFVEPFSLPIQAHGGDDEETWLLCGLIPEKEQMYMSMAVSSALLMLLLGGLLLAVLSWPFLKLRLLGDRQRVRRVDVVLVGVCSLAGASIATLTVLDALAFHRFRGEAEAQVERLAQEMEERLFAEIFKAHAQLEALEARASGLDLKSAANVERASEPFNPGDAYPFWDNFTLLDASGKQQVKWSTSSVVSTRISSRERPYYQRVRDRDLWRLERGGREIELYVQSLVTSTRGDRRVILSKPSALTGYTASMLSIPMPSLIDPVLPPGFAFVVIDSEDGSGGVLFHSDSERNLAESFFDETDQDRHLRSAVFAKRSETMGLRYWGRDYIARVEPVDGLPWTIVALREKELLRAVNLEWIVTTISFLLVYLGLLGAVLIGIAGVHPSYRASWLWPDRRRDYVVLSGILVVLVLAFGLAIWLLPGGSDLFLVSLAFPFVALVTAYLRLGKPVHRTGRNVALTLGGFLLVLIAFPLLDGSLGHDDRPGLRPLLLVLVALALALATKLPRRDGDGRIVSPAQSRYALAGVLLFLLTSVLPTLGFFESARRVQFASFVKHGQLRLALSLQERARRVQQEARRTRYRELGGEEEEKALKQFVEHRLAVPALPERIPQKLRGLDVYAAPFFETKVALLKKLPGKREGVSAAFRGEKCPCDPEREPSLLAEIFEERLPRASESSVELRELLHGASSDCAWNWQQGHAGSGLGLYRPIYPEGGLALVSHPTRPAEAGDMPVLLAGLPLLALLVWLVGFISRNVFLLDPTDPAWPAAGRGPARPGLRQLVVSRKGEWPPAEAFFEIDLCALRDGPPESGDRSRRLLRAARGRDVLIRGLDDILEGESFQGEVLELLDKLTEKHQNRIVILARTSPARLFPSTGRNGKGGPTEAEEGWRALIAAFDVEDMDVRAAQDRRLQELHPVLRQECGADRDLLEIACELKLDASSSVTREQVLEELGEAAEGYYRSLWASCTPQEEVVLEHLAEDGFVSERNRRTVRRLIARELVKRDPHLRLMNETFRRFVASAVCRDEVRAVEQQTEPSAWDRLRVPFFAGLAASLFFLFTTQQALLDGAAGTVAGFAAGIPALMQMMELFGGRFPGMR